MRKVVVLLLLVVFVLVGCAEPAKQGATLTVSSGNFLLYYPEGHKDAAMDVLNTLNDNYARITVNLRPDRIGLITVRLYPRLRDFHRAIGRPNLPNWVVGVAWGDSEIRMVSPKNPGPVHNYQTLITVAVHELAHVLTKRMGPVTPPHVAWLWESIALYEARQFPKPENLRFLGTGNHLRFTSVTDTLRKPEIYQIGYTIMEYLVEHHGYEAVRELVLHGGDIQQVLGMSADEFYAAWYAFAKAKYRP